MGGHADQSEMPLPAQGRQRERNLSESLNMEQIVESIMEAAKQGKIGRLKNLKAMGINFDFVDYDDRSPLHIAVENNHAQVVKFLVEKCGVPHDIPDRWSLPIAVAREKGHQDIVDFLENHKVKQDNSQMSSKQPLKIPGNHLCRLANEGNLKMLERWYKDGVDLSQSDYDKRTALHLACCNGKIEVVRFLLEVLPPEFIKSVDKFGHTPLNDAKSSGHTDIVNLLNIHLHASTDETKKKVAVYKKIQRAISQEEPKKLGEVLRKPENAALARELLTCSSKQYKEWRGRLGYSSATFIHRPGAMNSMSHTKTLLEEICHSKNKNKTFPMMKHALAAISSSSSSSSSSSPSSSAAAASSSSPSSSSPSSSSSRSSSSSSSSPSSCPLEESLVSAIVEVLIKRKRMDSLKLFLQMMRPDLELKKTGRLIYEAVKSLSKMAVQLLIEFGAKTDLAHRDYDNQSPLVFLIRNRDLSSRNLGEMVRLLGATNANVADSQHGLFPVHHVLQSGRPLVEKMDMIRELLTLGADVNCTDRAGFTPLQYAAGEPQHCPNPPGGNRWCASDRKTMISFLLSKGANISHQTHTDRSTALHLAAKSGIYAVYYTLLAAGADNSLRNISHFTAEELLPAAAVQESPPMTSLPVRPDRKPVENSEDSTSLNSTEEMDPAPKRKKSRPHHHQRARRKNSSTFRQLPPQQQQLHAEREEDYSLLDDMFSFLSSRVGERYKFFASCLLSDSMDPHELNTFLAELPDNYGLTEKIHKCLCQWRLRRGNGASPARLQRALLQAELLDLESAFAREFNLGTYDGR